MTGRRDGVLDSNDELLESAAPLEEVTVVLLVSWGASAGMLVSAVLAAEFGIDKDKVTG